MVKALLIAFPCVGIYIGVALAVYAFLNKHWPYDEDNDPYNDGDENKAVAIVWPIAVVMLPLLLAVGGMIGLGNVMDLIREHQKRGGGDGNV